ncbi:hypothetical protein MANES_01G029500v8 [Manihot esculenta]|uniref:Uncharacterized protein n=1 Tax=Manihot esculenta TaxID=3983 RepID=A0A2C9WH54_MANES|nr:hypothetical protein MANES_01G029500v8 [Manihot esculenta]
MGLLLCIKTLSSLLSPSSFSFSSVSSPLSLSTSPSITFSSSPTMSRHSLLFIFSFLFLLLFVISSAANLPNPTSPAVSSSRNNRQPLFCGSFSRKSSTRSLCIHFHRMNPQVLVPPPPTSPPSEEIDPRYGVEKRLVPSGPNPLHN